MPVASKDARGDTRPGVLRSLASKFSIFTATLVFWVVVTLLAYNLRQDNFDVGKGLLLCVVVILVSGAISRFTIRLLARPLKLLQAGIASVRNGGLEPIQISRTGDEIEFLGESFNGMIEALAASRKEIREHQELLAFAHSSARGSSGFSFASSRSSSLVSSSCGTGTAIFTSTISSPRTPSFVADGTPFSLSRSFCPDCVPGGILSSVRPSMVGTSTFAPSAASVTLTGTVRWMSSPSRRNMGCSGPNDHVQIACRATVGCRYCPCQPAGCAAHRASQDMVEGGMQFALGAVMAVRRDALDAVGGVRPLADFCADDFVLGNRIAKAGYQVVLSHYKVEHVLVGRSLAQVFSDQLRWMKSTRFSRPKGHAGSGLIYAVPFGLMALLLGLGHGSSMHTGRELLLLAWVNRMLLALVVGWGIMRDRRALRLCWLYPLHDLLGFCLWIASFCGERFLWRGEGYRLAVEGRIVPEDRPIHVISALPAGHDWRSAKPVSASRGEA